MSCRIAWLSLFGLLAVSIAAAQTISPAGLPSTRVGSSYSQTLVATPGGAGTTWSVIAGILPPGMSLTEVAGAGVISGQGTQVGTYTFLIAAKPPGFTDPFSAPYTIIVSAMSITTATLPDGTAGVAYGRTMLVAGGFPNFNWSFGPGTVANGLTIDPATGFVSGTPLNAGSFPINVSVTDSGAPANTATRSYTWIVTGPPVINTSSLPSTEVGIPYSETLVASGGALPYSWSLALGSTLPPGLTLNATTGLISGVPSSAGAYPFTMQLADALNATASRALSITVQPPITVTTTALTGGAVGSAYSVTLQSSGGIAPVVWSITAGTLPSGLSLNQATGDISGVPTAQGSQTFTATATDALGAMASRQVTLEISELSITTGSSLPDGVQNTPYSTALAAAGGTGLSWMVSAGALPSGLTLDPSTGVISGTPGSAGTVSFTVTVTSTSPAAAANRQFTITIAAAPPPPLPNSITLTVPGTPGPAQQPALALTLGSTYPLQITATITLTFSAEGSGADNPEVRFSNGTRVASLTFPAGSLQSSPAGGIAILTGTVGGTITLTAQLADSEGRNVTPSATPVQAIVISQGVPVITSARIVNVTGGFNFIVIGYSTTREISSGTFRFTAASGTALSASEFTVPLTSAFATWYGNVQSAGTGSQFTLTVPFQVQGAAAPVASGTAQLSNAKGASAVSAPASP